MKEPPSKRQQQNLLNIAKNCKISLLLLLLTLPCYIAVSPAIDENNDPSDFNINNNYKNNYGASFISNPSIYSYTVSNQAMAAAASSAEHQTPTKQHQQQESLTNLNNNNYINFASSSQQQDKRYYAPSNGNKNNNNNNLNRNYYYTNVVASPPSQQTPSVSVATQILTPTQQQQQQQQQQQMPLPTQPAPQTGCTLDRLAVYKVVLHTYWTRDLFPKHYPDWRPTAQWTKTLGRTHNANYALYHIGQQATPGVKQFAETGKTEILDSIAGEQQQLQQQQQSMKLNSAKGVNFAGGSSSSERSVFDEFTMPAIQLGAGRSEAKLFVDSNHSLVSLMTRIVPSPDWYIGVDSFELCVGGSWIDTVTVELDPLDAGTDNGFTFTAPNWPTEPQGVIYRITSRYPAHPAGSFYYPKSKRLPPIATFQFIKLKEYELSEVFNFAEDDRKYEMVKTQTHLETEHNHVEMNNELSASIERERQTEYGTATTASQIETEHDRIRSKLLAKMNPNYNTKNNSAIIPKNDKHALLQSIANSYKQRKELTNNRNATTSSFYSRRRASMKNRRRDCRVSHWSDWTPCSKSCGIGEMHRYRKVIKHGKRGGRPCPALQESKWCGTEQGCHAPESYFNWSDT